MYKFYLQEGDINEATAYYVDIISQAIKMNGEQIERTSSLRSIATHDKVLTISCKAAFKVWFNNPRQYLINWYQGIVPEEAMCTFENSLSKYPRKYLHRLFESITLGYSAKNLFVSNAMCKHYQRIYGYNKSNYFIMPCFNQRLTLSCFTAEKYATPSFVYAGSLSHWQCITETLKLFKEIQDLLPQASLTLLTKEQEKAASLCRQCGVKVDIGFVPREELQVALAKYKYGFIVRDDIEVNRVATPTKMNSYMAAGVIPVYSDVVLDFRDIFSGIKYVVPFMNNKECLSQILDIERCGVDIGIIKSEFERIFSTYYSESTYIESLCHFLARKS